MEIDLLTSSFLGLRDKLHHIALKYLGSDEDAKDALQDTWLKLRSKGEVETTIEARNKLVTVLRNVCIDHLRKAREIPIDVTVDIQAYTKRTHTPTISATASIVPTSWKWISVMGFP